MSAPRLDWTDVNEVNIWLDALRVAVEDAHGVTLDLLRPLRRRDLGHREHARLHREARAKIAQLLDFANPAPEGGPADSGAELGDPAGTGGAGPVH